MNTKLWITVLALGALLWADLLGGAQGELGPGRGPAAYQLGIIVGKGLPLFLGSGVVGGIVYAFSRKVRTALWTWTVVLLSLMLLLTIGAVSIQKATPSSLAGIAQSEVTVEQAVDMFEHGCIGMSKAMGKDLNASQALIDQMIRRCLLSAARSTEAKLATEQVSPEVRRKFEAIVQEVKRRANTR